MQFLFYRLWWWVDGREPTIKATQWAGSIRSAAIHMGAPVGVDGWECIGGPNGLLIRRGASGFLCQRVVRGEDPQSRRPRIRHRLAPKKARLQLDDVVQPRKRLSL